MRWNCYLFFIFALLLVPSCQDIDMINDFSPIISFDVTDQLLEGKEINCMDVDEEGNVCVGSGNDLICINKSNQNTFHLDYPIRDVAIAPGGKIWIGSGGGGLGQLTGKEFKWFTSANSGLPRDYISDVEIAPDGTVWFSSSAYNEGGLGIFNGKKFEFLTPDNSPLNQNIIDDIEIDMEGVVYIATAGKVGRSNVYRISGQKWDCLGDEDGTFYWIFSISAGSPGILYTVEDFSLSSMFHDTNILYEYRNDKWNKIETEGMPRIDFFARFRVDKRNYCWIAGYSEDYPVVHVFNGKSWVSSPGDIFPDDDFITEIEVDPHNNIWIGTYRNGIFMLKQ